MIERVQKSLASAGIPCALISNMVNVQWMTEFTGSFAYVLVTPNEAIFITDSRYTVQARDQVKGVEHVTFGTPKTGMDLIQETIQRLGHKQLGFESSIAYATFQDWSKRLNDIELMPLGNLITDLRKVKTADEIRRIAEACKLADACIAHASRMIQPGVSETDIGIDIEFFFRRNGAAIGFDPIAVSGPNTAKPHGRPSERKLQSGDFVTFDIGCTLDGYNSDITRTFVVGQATDRHREIYDQVLKALLATTEMLVPGANGRDLDAKAREILDERDLSQYFGHSLGHGLGRDVHDPGRLSVTADEPIAENMVFTIEPGVYIEDFGGVRIEDDVVATANGPQVLTSFPRELTEL